jgi:shikimate dehydrogenase
MTDALTFRLLGHGIAYSASPAMMAAAFDALDLPHRYELVDIPAADVPATVARLREADAGGANVTVPHKTAVAAEMDELSDVAREAQAVNTVVHADGRLIGHNTDVAATVEAIERLRPTGVRHALVLGAGGVSRAVQLALRKTGTERITVLRRSDGSIGRLADAISEADLVVNATPVGTGVDETLVPAALLRRNLAVLDLVYRPSPTRLVREARAIGAPAEAGAAILLGQAWRSLELWLGVTPPVEAMRAALDAELGGTSGA